MSEFGQSGKDHPDVLAYEAAEALPAHRYTDDVTITRSAYVESNQPRQIEEAPIVAAADRRPPAAIEAGDPPGLSASRGSETAPSLLDPVGSGDTFGDLARDMLTETGQPPDSAGLARVLASYLEAGVVSTLTQSRAADSGDTASDPTRHFFDRTQQALKDGPLVDELLDVAAAQAAAARAELESTLRPRELRKLREAEAEAAAARYAERQAEVQQLRERVQDRHSVLQPFRVGVDDLRRDDDVALHLANNSVDPQRITCAIRGKVKGFTEVQVGSKPELSGVRSVVIEVGSDERNMPDLFNGTSLPPGTRIVVAGTALDNGYVGAPGKIAGGETPLILWNGTRMPVAARTDYFRGEERKLQVHQITINGIDLFPREE